MDKSFDSQCFARRVVSCVTVKHRNVRIVSLTACVTLILQRVHRRFRVDEVTRSFRTGFDVHL